MNFNLNRKNCKGGKMKITFKFIICIFILLVYSNTLKSQIYIQGYAGYGLSVGSTILAVQVDETKPTFEAVYGTYGKGLNFGGGFGFTLSQNIIAEISVLYQTNSSDINNINLNGEESVNTLESSMLAISPGLKIITEIGNIKPYANIGVLIAKPSLSIIRAGFLGDDSKFTGDYAIGFTGGAGVMIPIGKPLMVFTELSLTSISWTPTEETITNDSGDSETINLSTKYTVNNSTQIADAKPFGSFALKVGILLEF